MPISPAFSDQFERWASDHATVLYRVAFRMLGDGHYAEDVLQDTFRSAWTSRHLYDDSRSERAWLLAILRRRVADHWRKRSVREQTIGDEVSQQAAPTGPIPFNDELSGPMQRALDRLPAELRDTLLLVVVGELTHQEAAQLQGIPLGTVLSRVSRARTRLREFLLESSAALRASVAQVGNKKAAQ